MHDLIPFLSQPDSSSSSAQPASSSSSSSAQPISIRKQKEGEASSTTTKTVKKDTATKQKTAHNIVKDITKSKSYWRWKSQKTIHKSRRNNQ